MNVKYKIDLGAFKFDSIELFVNKNRQTDFLGHAQKENIFKRK